MRLIMECGGRGNGCDCVVSKRTEVFVWKGDRERLVKQMINYVIDLNYGIDHNLFRYM